MIALKETGKVSSSLFYLGALYSRSRERYGQVKDIGVSNFTIEQIEGIVEATGVTPVRTLSSPGTSSCDDKPFSSRPSTKLKHTLSSRRTILSHIVERKAST